MICRRVKGEEGGKRREEGRRRMEDVKREDGRREEDGRRKEDDDSRRKEDARREELEEEEEEEGEVYVWGDRMAAIGERKVLDRFGNVVNYQNLSINQFKPRLVSGVEGAIRVEAGGRHNAILTSKEEIYVFGDNEHGQLGLDTKEFRAIAQPVPVKLNFLTENQLSEDWEEGGSKEGKEGRGEEEGERREEEEEEEGRRKEVGGRREEKGGRREERGKREEERIRRLPNKIRDIALGLTFTLILTKKGKLFILGEDKPSSSYQPHILRQITLSSKINEISANGFKWLALDQNGGVYEREGTKLCYLTNFEEGHVVEVRTGLDMCVCLVGVNI